MWQHAVKGFPVGMIAANDHLVVSTDAGALHAFGATTEEPKVLAADKPPAWERVPQWRGQVAKLKANLSGGCGLDLGWNSGELAKELALQTTLQVIVAEPDAGVAAKARAALSKEGAWARRLRIVSGVSDVLKLPPYFAEVVLSETLTSLDDGARIWTRTALACVMNLDSKERTYLSSTRPGCTNSMIPAAGLLNAPNYAHGCVCNYPFLTSFALFHLPEAAKWAPKEKPDVKFQKNPNAN